MIGTKLLDRYQLTAVLGRGGMGVVYRARDPVLAREVAVKLVPTMNLTPAIAERFQREARIVAQMDHPGIVPIHDFGRHEGSLFLVMPLLAGIALKELIRQRSLTVTDTLTIGIQVAEALDYSHSRGVIHRDVKPGNVMVSREGGELRARVLDFGLARRPAQRRLTETGKLPGTLDYLSPEQISEVELDGRSDLYSLGAVLYECLAGKPPFSGALYTTLFRIVNEPPEPLRSQGVKLDPELEATILGCLAKEPSERPERGQDLALALSRHRDRLRARERPPSTRRGPSWRPPLVGRESELAELERRLERAVAGECQFAVVGGERGIGKGRLVAELAEVARGRQVRVLRGRFSSRDGSLPYEGLCELILDYFRAPELRTAELPDLADLLPELVKLFPVLSEIEAVRAGAVAEADPAALAPVTQLAPGGTKNRIFEPLARTLIRLGGGQPLLLLVDDLHACSLSVAGLEYIVYRLGPTPTLVVGTYRQTEIDKGHALSRMLARFQGNPRFGSLVLEPLRGDDFRRLVALYVGSSELRDELVAELYETTEGNPLFARELVRSLLETGAIHCDDAGSWALSEEAGITREALPATIQQAVEERIERLAPRHRQVLAVAAVLGRSFAYDDLEALLDDPSDLEDVVEALVRQEILDEDRKTRGGRLRFRSGAVREILYGELSRRQRRSYHRQHAFHLETRHAGRLERLYPQLVYHFAHGDVAEKTVEYGLAQARSALAAWSPEDAMRAASTALDFAEDEGGASPTLAVGELLGIMAAAHRALGQTAKARAAAERAADVCARAGEAARAAEAALLAAETAWQERRIEIARDWILRGAELARQGDAPETLRRLLTLGATVANLRGHYREAQEFLDEAAELARKEAEQTGEGPLPVGGTLIVGLPNLVADVDPGSGEVKAMDELEVAVTIFETLLAADPEGNLTPALCEAWESSPDGHRWVLTLRPDGRFSDGQPLRGADVKASLERSARRGARSPLVTLLSTIVGGDEFLHHQAAEIRGVEILAPDPGLPERSRREQIVFHLVAPLPIFPALLTDPRTAIVREGPAEGDAEASGQGPGPLLGTGPFRLVAGETAPEEGRIIVERSPDYWRGAPAALDRIEFRTLPDPAAIAAGLRRGEIDVGKDLLPEELEELVRDPQFRSGLAETTQPNVYFVLFNTSGPLTRDRRVRRALAGVVRSNDLVWRTLGRFAQPAVSLIPPGIPGHDPGRRPRGLSREEAGELLRQAALTAPIRLSAAVHPLIRDHYRPLLEALLAEWAVLGVEVRIETPTWEAFLARSSDSAGIDLWIGRWHAVYSDADIFTYGLFHRRAGFLRSYYSSPAGDRLVERARRESRPGVRQALYRKFERLLAEEVVLVPLFHDVDYRVAGPRVRGLRLQSTPPYVHYAQIGKVKKLRRSQVRPLAGGGEIHVPIPVRVDQLDPKAARVIEELDAVAVLFEPLTRVDEGARVVPWLAAAFEPREEGRIYRFRLRPQLRFHDGRRLTARDVRYSFERLLRTPRIEVNHFLLLPIRGARALRDGEAKELAGFRILSTTEFEIELELPLAIFPALLTHPCVAIVPEGSQELAGSWRQGCVGTGPFRVVRFDRGEQLDLEKNPYYWRSGYPRSDRLVFHFGIDPESMLAGFRSGRFSLASDLPPADAELLRRDPELAAGWCESPRLATGFLALNTRRGPFADRDLRRAFAAALDLDEALRQTLGRQVIRARGLIPPGLLGYGGPPRADPPVAEREAQKLRGLRLRAALHPVFVSRYAPLWERLVAAWRELGVEIESSDGDLAALLEGHGNGAADLVALRWVADYPDTDAIVSALLHSQEGSFGGLYRSSEIDLLVEEGRREADPDRRHQIYRRIEEAIARDAWLIPLFYEQTYRLAQPGIEGLRIDLAFPEIRYEELRVRS